MACVGDQRKSRSVIRRSQGVSAQRWASRCAGVCQLRLCRGRWLRSCSTRRKTRGSERTGNRRTAGRWRHDVGQNVDMRLDVDQRKLEGVRLLRNPSGAARRTLGRADCSRELGAPDAQIPAGGYPPAQPDHGRKHPVRRRKPCCAVDRPLTTGAASGGSSHTGDCHVRALKGEHRM